MINNNTFIADLTIGSSVIERTPFGNYNSIVTDVNETTGIITVKRSTGTIAHYSGYTQSIINYKDLNGTAWKKYDPATSALYFLQQAEFTTDKSPWDNRKNPKMAVPRDEAHKDSTELKYDLVHEEWTDQVVPTKK